MIPLPPIHSVLDLLKHSLSLLSEFLRIPRKGSAIILRVPGIFPAFAWFILTARRMPFAVEAMADADAQFAPDAFKSKYRALYGMLWSWIMRAQCRGAAASSYVTREALQRSFPPRPGSPTTSYTTLDLPQSVLATSPRAAASFEKSAFRLVNVAMMQKHLKGQDIIIDAVSRISKYVNVELWLVGDGETRTEFENQALAAGVGDKVRFLGRLNAGDEIYSVLDQCDLFVLPSRQEGLPAYC